MFAIFCEAIAKYSLDTAACIMTSVFTATNISVHGTAAQKAKYLPPFLRGERTFSIAMTEPQSGSDAAAARTKAALDGDEWVVSGNKTFCSGAHIPGTTIVLLARTGEERYKGLSLFILPNDAPGHRPAKPRHDPALSRQRSFATGKSARRSRRRLEIHRRAPRT
jgi:alkylation response protein AidB-like acyl-CoA dehydrogenase